MKKFVLLALLFIIIYIIFTNNTTTLKTLYSYDDIYLEILNEDYIKNFKINYTDKQLNEILDIINTLELSNSTITAFNSDRIITLKIYNQNKSFIVYYVINVCDFKNSVAYTGNDYFLINNYNKLADILNILKIKLPDEKFCN